MTQDKQKFWEQLKALEEAGSHVGRLKLQLTMLTDKGYYGGGGLRVFDNEDQIAEYVKNIKTTDDGQAIIGYRISYDFFADKDVKLYANQEKGAAKVG